jgi:hypothetical protein
MDRLADGLYVLYADGKLLIFIDGVYVGSEVGIIVV